MQFLKNTFMTSVGCLGGFLCVGLFIAILALVFKGVCATTDNPGLGVLAMIIAFCINIGVIRALLIALGIEKP